MQHENRKSNNTQKLTKIVVSLSEDAPSSEETLWAERVAEALYRLDNTPWYAMGCALDDIVECEERPGEFARFVRVVRPSGNRTIRLFVPDTLERNAMKQKIFAYLQRFGCVFEEFGSSKGLIAVSIPVTANWDSISAWLSEIENNQSAYWESGNF